MNWDRVEGKWKQMRGAARAKWGRLTDDDLDLIAGHRDQLIGRLQERYGIARDEAEKQTDDWAASTVEDC
ncbi:MAG TPA: CsbD family protein [Terriglobia bacterium]|nr:CsbD family protein [Terriglobia bacterium]